MKSFMETFFSSLSDHIAAVSKFWHPSVLPRKNKPATRNPHHKQTDGKRSTLANPS